jgi:hypothetical protein
LKDLSLIRTRDIHERDVKLAPEKVGDDVIPQLNFIETALRAGEGEQ